MRHALHVLLFAAAALILSAQAAGAPPTREEVDVDRTRTIPAGALCSFDFVVHSEGHQTTTTLTNPDGSFDRFMVHLSSWETTYTNPANGKTLRTVLAGPVIVEALPDGRALVRIPGNDGHFVVKGEGPIYTDNGLIVWIAPSVAQWPNAIEILHASGGYRTTEEFAAVICGALA
jgi:hypothetical protein